MTKHKENIHNQAIFQYCEFCSKLNPYHCQGTSQPCYFCKKTSSFSANMKNHTEFIHSQGTYEHCDVCSEPNVYKITMTKHFKIIQSQGTIQHCDCCTKPYQLESKEGCLLRPSILTFKTFVYSYFSNVEIPRIKTPPSSQSYQIHCQI